MPEPKRLNPALIPIAIAMMLLGLLSLMTSGITIIFIYNASINVGHQLTVPASATLDLDPGESAAIYERVTGSHITTNRPLIPLAPEMTIEILDAQTSQPIEVQTVNWYQQFAVFNLRDKRHAIRTFTVPDSGSITIKVANLPEEHVFYVGPTHERFMSNTLPRFAAWAIASLMLVIAGSALIIRRLARVAPTRLPSV